MIWQVPLHQQWFGNPLSAYLTSFAFLLVGWGLVWVFQTVLIARLKRWAATTKTTLDDILLNAIEKTIMPLVYVSVLLAAVKSLTLPPLIEKSLSLLWSCVVMIALVRVALGVIRHIVYDLWLARRPDAAQLEKHVRTLMPILSVFVWGLGIVLLLDNLGFKITAIVAGLGIGGIAIALAAQTVLGDIFGYVVIMLDKPFEIDDAIHVGGDFVGTVEHIGIKTTRVRSQTGEQLIFSNKDLTDSRIRNFKRMELRRVPFTLGLTYDTSAEKIKRALSIVQEAIATSGQTRFDRAHFASYGDFALKLDVVYFVLSGDYNLFMNIQQTINFKIKEAFERENIAFAYPTQTIILANPQPAL